MTLPMTNGLQEPLTQGETNYSAFVIQADLTLLLLRKIGAETDHPVRTSILLAFEELEGQPHTAFH